MVRKPTKEEIKNHLLRIDAASQTDWDEFLADMLERVYPTLQGQTS